MRIYRQKRVDTTLLIRIELGKRRKVWRKRKNRKQPGV
jgi:hypothetical protein